MKKLLIACSALLLLTGTAQTADVYICISRAAKKYHYTKSCRGIKRCTHTIEQVSKTEAMRRGYTLCGYED